MNQGDLLLILVPFDAKLKDVDIRKDGVIVLPTGSNVKVISKGENDEKN